MRARRGGGAVRAAGLVAGAALLGPLGLGVGCGSDTLVGAADSAPEASSPASSVPVEDAQPVPGKDAALADARPVRDAADARAIRDASANDDAPLTTTEQAEVPGLTDFDFDGTTLVYRKTGVELYRCTMPGCTRGAPLGVASVGDHHVLAGGQVYFVGFGGPLGSTALYSVPVGGGPVTALRSPGPTDPKTTLFNLFGGESRLVASVDVFARPLEEWSFPIARGGSVPRATPYLHEREGATITRLTQLGPYVVTGSSVPTMPFSVSVVAASPRTFRGAPLPHPIVAIANGRIHVCPIRTDCAAWLNVLPSTPVATLGIDTTHLYFASYQGLGRCTLEELDVQRTCTIESIVTGEAVEAPLYLVAGPDGAATDVWYRSGSRVRRVGLPP